MLLTVKIVKVCCPPYNGISSIWECTVTGKKYAAYCPYSELKPITTRLFERILAFD